MEAVRATGTAVGPSEQLSRAQAMGETCWLGLREIRGLDPDVYQGFAWGMGIDRIAMLKYGMSDLRQLFDSDVRWLSHYGFKPLDLPTLAGGLST
jgi:hypothetical protein